MENNIQKQEGSIYENKEGVDFHLEKGVDGITVVGDRIGRLPFIEFVEPHPGEIILEAGCGGGWVARKLAGRGARVIGCDSSESMLSGAVKIEEELKQGIEYVQADITQLPFKDGSFDKVTNIATLFHLSPEEVQKFFGEVCRVLKQNGEFFLSLNHFDLFVPGNPVRDKNTDWMTLEPVSNDDLSRSQVFTEHYWNKDGKVFIVDIWYHPKPFLLQAFQEAGLEMEEEHDQQMTEEVLQEFNKKGPAGYAAFWQAKLKKQ